MRTTKQPTPTAKTGKSSHDVVREGKGHTEGYEPHITAELIKVMRSAKGGKIREGRLVKRMAP